MARAKRKPALDARLVAIEETLVAIVQDLDHNDQVADLFGAPGMDDIGSAAEWLQVWVAERRKPRPPKVKLGWGSERLNRRQRR